MQAKLALEDGTVFTGTGFGRPRTCGEVVFNTSMTSYQGSSPIRPTPARS